MCTLWISYGHVYVCNNSKTTEKRKVYALQGTACTKNAIPDLIQVSFDSF